MTAEYYVELRALHIACAVLSFWLFVLRGIWMIGWPHLLSRRWVRIAPHLVDTVLLASAIALTLVIRQFPLVDHWLTAKVVALLAYIALGTIALKRGRTRAIRVLAFLAAMAVFLYIAGVARSHDAWPW